MSCPLDTIHKFWKHWTSPVSSFDHIASTPLSTVIVTSPQLPVLSSRATHLADKSSQLSRDITNTIASETRRRHSSSTFAGHRKVALFFSMWLIDGFEPVPGSCTLQAAKNVWQVQSMARVRVRRRRSPLAPWKAIC